MAKRKHNQPKEHFDLDIVIPVYGRPDLLQKCLTSVEATKGDIKAKVIIVDDKGPDQEKLSGIYHSLNGHSRVIYHKQNQGFSRSVNDGINQGSAPYVLILNSDIELLPGCLQAMMNEFDDPQIGIVGPKLLFPPDQFDPRRPAGKVQHAGMAVNIRGEFIHPNLGWSSDHPKVNERRILQSVTGACIMARREALKKVHHSYRQSGDPTTGPFNEVYGLGTWEDVELCFAARAAGYNVIYTPLAEAYHFTNASVLQKPQGEGFPIQRNQMIFMARCGHLVAWDDWLYS